MNETPTNNARFARPESVMLREIAGELLLLDSATDAYFGLNPTGAAMFQSLADGASFDETKVALTAKFDVDADVLAADLSQLVEELLERGLLVPAA